jgi:probable F420-dependent oxidoreductase
MQIGVVYPQIEMPPDVGAIKAFAQGVEAMGFSHILAYDHVIGANTASRPDWTGPYTLATPFQDPFVLFSYLSGITTTLRFATGVLILAQRQTVLVAKQAACLDIVSQGRFRLGVGVGWNDVEYEALGMNFRDRGKRYEEQIGVLRALWANDAVTFRGAAHSITDAGINPRPLTQPFPVWMGGGPPDTAWIRTTSDTVLRRIARIGDGWYPRWQPDDKGLAILERFRGYCREYGRDADTFPMEGRSPINSANQSHWGDIVARWRTTGVSHFSVVTQGDGLKGADQHLRRLEEFRQALPR